MITEHLNMSPLNEIKSGDKGGHWEIITEENEAK